MQGDIITFQQFTDELARKYRIKDGATLVAEHKKRLSHQLNGEWRGQHIPKKIGSHLGRDLEGVRILDIGAGYGGCSVELIKLGAEVISVDVEAEALKLAEIYSQDVVSLTYHVVEADSPNLLDVVPANSIDLILMTSVIEHIEDVDNLLANSRKTLKPGGTFFTVMPNGLNHKIIIREPHCGAFGLSILPPQMWHRFTRNIPLVYYRTFNQYEAIFDRYGFSGMSILPEDHPQRPVDRIVAEAEETIGRAYSTWLSGNGGVLPTDQDIQLLHGCIETHIKKMKHNTRTMDPALFNYFYGLDTWWAFYGIRG